VSQLTLRELLAQRDFGLQLKTKDASVLEREIFGAHALEVSNPTRWLQEGWVMLTSGMRLHSRREQRALVEELVEARIAALGFAVDVNFKHIPRAVLDEANGRGLPVFSVPLPTPLREIIAFVAQARLSRELYTLRRAFSMQRFLMEALQEPEAEDALARRLASVLDSSVAIFSPSGQLLAGRGDVPLDSMWKELTRREPLLQRFTMGRLSVISTPVEAEGTIAYWLVVATQSQTPFDQLGRAVTEAAARLLGVIALGHRAALAEERALRASLLSEIFERDLTPTSAGVADRLEAHGFRSGIGTRILWIVPRQGDGDELAEISQVVETSCKRHRQPCLVMLAGDCVAALTEMHCDSRSRGMAIAKALRDAGHRVQIGISSPLDANTPFARALRDARLAANAGAHQLGDGGIVNIDDLDLVGLTLSAEDGDGLSSKARDMLEPLRSNPPLLESLQTYFELGLDVGKAAARLHLHPNSLRYRLAQIERLLDINLSHPRAIANVYIALRAVPDAFESPPRAEEQIGLPVKLVAR
jgi:PucR family transcriptional regulator, purine catabolism regulatory protein